LKSVLAEGFIPQKTENATNQESFPF
jgi:hypothetical protein